MAEMNRAGPDTVLAPEFDDFLFAPIGEEQNGMLLSVISALARLDLDPWQEAANLAKLPVTTAARRLASLIASLPGSPSTHLDPGTTAARLIAHLPRRAGFNTTSAGTSHSVGAPAMLQTESARYIVALILMVLFGGLGIAASQRSSAHVDNIDAPASGVVSPPTTK
jgi:hypothetical protein